MNFSEKKILIVNDDPWICEAMAKKIKEQLGCSVTFYNCVDEARYHIEQGATFDACIIDKSFKEGGRIDFAPFLKKHYGAALPVLMQTAFAEVEDIGFMSNPTSEKPDSYYQGKATGIHHLTGNDRKMAERMNTEISNLVKRSKPPGVDLVFGVFEDDKVITALNDIFSGMPIPAEQIIKRGR